jgi:hypothetical protein
MRMPSPRRNSSPTPSKQSRRSPGPFTSPHRDRVQTNASL